jgi:hypothetical protein
VTTHVSTRRDSDTDAGPGVDSLPLAHFTGVRLAVVLGGGLALTDVTRMAGAPSYVALAALALLVATASLGMGSGTALAAGFVGWLLATGFVVHHFGVLAYDGPADLVRLALLLAVAVAATHLRR